MFQKKVNINKFVRILIIWEFILIIFPINLAPYKSAYGINPPNNIQLFNKENSDGHIFFADFEDGKDPFKLDSTNADVIVNYKGITNENSFTGNSAFKIDISFKSGSYYFLSIPFIFPAESKLNFSAKILVDNDSSGQAGLGIGFKILPCIADGVNGSGSSEWFKPENGKWEEVQIDIPMRGKTVASKALPHAAWGLNIEEMGIYMDRVGLYLSPKGVSSGNEFNRIIVYIDDILIDGNLINNKQYNRIKSKKWRPADIRINTLSKNWENLYNKAENLLLNLTSLKKISQSIKEELELKLSEIKKQIEGIQSNGFVSSKAYFTIDPMIKMANQVVENITIIEGLDAEQKCLIYIVNPTSPFWIRPKDILIPGRIGNEINITATPGEYESASFVISAFENLDNVEIKNYNLKGENKNLNASCIDIKIVKCWYQGSSAGKSHEAKNEKVLVPELLLKDDSMILVDTIAKENYLKLKYPVNNKYICISKMIDKSSKTEIPTIEDMPVQDSKKLLPFSVKKNEKKQIWITIKVPEDSKSGIFNGRLELKSKGVKLCTINLKLKVLPFKLEKTDFISSIYYQGFLDSSGMGSISSYNKSRLQYQSEIENMVSHGVDNPIIALPKKVGKQEVYDEGLLLDTLKIRGNAGAIGTDIFVSNFFYRVLNITKPKLVTEIILDDILKENIHKEVFNIKNIFGGFGIQNVYFYGFDEARGKRLTCQREAWEEIKKSGGNIYASGLTDINIRSMHDIQDVHVNPYLTSKSFAKQWHLHKHKIWSYANPQGGLENPFIYRRNYGFLLWSRNYDGAATWAYQSTVGNTWNDFDSIRGRDYNFTYPTIDGVIDTIQWEGYREGIDDIKYITTLYRMIKKLGSNYDIHNEIQFETCDPHEARKKIIEKILYFYNMK